MTTSPRDVLYRMRGRLTPAAAADLAWFAGLAAIAVFSALALAATLLWIAGNPPGSAFSSMLQGSLGSLSSFVTTLNHTGPLLIVAIGAAIAGRAGFVNIGQEGQFVIGATLAVVVGLTVPGPIVLVLPAVLLAAALGGACWAGIAAILRHQARVSEVITTLLLNFIAFALVSYLVNRSWLLQETVPEGSIQPAAPQSDPVSATARLPVLISGSGYRLHVGIFLALGLALAAGFAIARTTWGFRLRMFGLNKRTAKRAGVSDLAFGSGALLMSGAFAGLAGGVILSGVAFRVNPGLSNNYGWEGLLVALVAGFSPIFAIFVAFLFGALRAGGGVLAATGVNSAIVGVVQSLIVLAIMLPSLYVRRRKRRRQARLMVEQIEAEAGANVAKAGA
ncbi:MAG: hypothetical protein U5K29_10150 [Acidimicrobiales bacterium]|nr:hypothetical protein [Acidimicrobiales bacterium]